MKNLSLKRVFVNLMLAVFIGFGVMAATGDQGAGILAATIVVSLTAIQVVLGRNLTQKGALNMALQTEVWVQDIQETLFYENEFIRLAVDHSSYVTNKTVHVPQSGGKPNVEKNRSENVATIQRRTDTELTYDLDNYTTDPFLVKNVEDLQISYDKRQSVLGQHIATLRDVVATETLQKWAVDGSTSHVIRTSGADTAMLPSSTATGKRLLLTYQDIAKAAALMDIDKVPTEGRFLVIPTAMFYGLFSDKDLVAQQSRIGADMIASGVVAKLFNFNIITRGSVVRYTNAAANNLRDSSANDAATDCAGAIAFSRYAVSQALGEIMVYMNEGDAQSYGDIMSAEVNHAAHYLRANNFGKVSIAQGYVAP